MAVIDNLDARDMEQIRKALLPAYGVAEVLNHTPTQHESGLSCDERGCAICNAGLDCAVDIAVQAEDTRDLEELLDSIECMIEALRGRL